MPTLGQIDLLNPLADHDLNAGLVSGWLPLDNTYGGPTLWDIAGRNHGTLTNGPTWGAGPGEFGALTFDGTDDCITVPDEPSLSPARYSLAAVMRFRSLPTGAQSWIPVAKGYVTNQWTYGFEFYGGGGGAAEFNFGGSVAPDVAKRCQWMSPTLTARQWYAFAGTYDGTTYRLYVDGVQRASNAASATGVTTAPLTFGGRSVNGTATNFSPVDIAAAWLHNRALSASEAYAFYDQSRRDYPDLLRRVPTATWFVGAGAASSFQSAWAARSNVLIQPLVSA